MNRLFAIGFFFISASTFTVAQQQPSAANQPSSSLGDYARTMRPREGPSTRPAKVYTNDDVEFLKGTSGVAVTSTSVPHTITSGTASGAHGEKYFRAAYAKLIGQKELHMRELDVLEKQLNLNEVQYYPDPNKALKEQYTRADISKKQAAVNAKKLEIQQDDQALDNFRDELRRDGGQPGWLTGSAAPADQLSAAATPYTPPAPDKDSTDKIKTKGYWQGEFSGARASVAKAAEVQRLVEDEISLLRMRQVQEPSADAQTDINAKLTARQTDLLAAMAASDAAKKSLDDLQKTFDGSGAPGDWSLAE